MAYKVLIVEDEMLIAGIIKNRIEENGFECAGIAIDYEESLELLETEQVDMALLDINISGKKSGVDVAQHINEKYEIPFVYLTSYSDENTVTQIKETFPAGYLSKPVNDVNLRVTMELMVNQLENKEESEEKVVLKIGKQSYFINPNEVMYAQSDHVYIELVLTDKKLLLRSTLGNIIDMLPEGTLKQVNRGVAVNPKFISKVSSKSIELDDVEFSLSPNFKPEFQ
jgi:DNA-binding LytR/AlgR family response regulator